MIVAVERLVMVACRIVLRVFFRSGVLMPVRVGMTVMVVGMRMPHLIRRNPPIRGWTGSAQAARKRNSCNQA
jgi:hypothetical protein